MLVFGTFVLLVARSVSDVPLMPYSRETHYLVHIQEVPE